MRNTKKINLIIPQFFPIPLKHNKCGSCPHRQECILGKALNRKKKASYHRMNRDILNETTDVVIQVISCPCHTEKVSTTKGLFGEKRWYPTYIILLCVTLAHYYKIAPAYIINKILVNAETRIPSQSTIYRWVDEYKKYMLNPEKSRHADVFNPINALSKLCGKAIDTVKSSSIYELFNNYIAALQRVFDIETRPYSINIPF